MDYDKKLEELKSKVNSVNPNFKHYSPSFNIFPNIIEGYSIIVNIVIVTIITLSLLAFFIIKRPSIVLTDKKKISCQKIMLWLLVIMGTMYFGFYVYRYKSNNL